MMWTESEKAEALRDAPDWGSAEKCHEWKNHVPADVADMWATFTEPQRFALFLWAHELASREEWD